MRRGVPHFIANYSATDDVLTRALPVLIALFLLSSISAIDLNWDGWQMALATGGGLALLLIAWGILNRIRGRPLLSYPDRVGFAELAIFIFVPAVLPLIFGGDWIGAAVTLLAQAVMLALVFGITSYGLVAISIWAIGRLFKTLGQTFRLFTRSLPLLLIGFMFLFINAEAWQSAGELDESLLWTVTVVFAILAGIFLGSKIPKELHAQTEFNSWPEVVQIAEEAPVSYDGDPAARVDPLALTGREKGNLWLVVFITQSFRLLLVSVLIGLFFVGLGLLIIRPSTIQRWTGEAPDVVWKLPWELFGNTIEVTGQLLQVAVFLGGFAAVYFSVYVTTDQALRSDFFEDTMHEIRQNLAARAIYLGKRSTSRPEGAKSEEPDFGQHSGVGQNGEP